MPATNREHRSILKLIVDQIGEGKHMMKVRTYPTLLLALMGFLDCITTVVGIIYYGAVELNPLMSGVVTTNIAAFVVLKLATTVSVCLIFIQADKILMKSGNQASRTFTWTKRLLRLATAGVIAFLCLTVANNLIVLINAH
jgi:hypothetical protein